MTPTLTRNDSLTSLADQAGNVARDGLNEMAEAVPSKLSRAAAQAEDLARRGIARARATGTQVREQVNLAGDRTVGYIRDEPFKAVMIAVAAGAATALFASWMARRRG